MYTIRPAVEEDYGFLYELHRSALREYVEPIWGWQEEWQEEYYRKKFDPRQRQIIVIDGRDAGVVVVEERPDEVYLGLIELMPEFQGRGFGTDIIRRLQCDAHEKRLPLALHVLRTNHPARRLYERIGFKVVSEEEFKIRMICVPDNQKPAEGASRTRVARSGLIDRRFT